jgi:transposase-like protein
MSRRDDPALAAIQAAAANRDAWADTVRTLALDAMAAGVSVAGIARAADVSRNTLYRWRDEA